MMKSVLLTAATLALVGCSSGGNSGRSAGAGNGTFFDRPAKFSKVDFEKNKSEYADEWVKAGKNVDSFKKVVIPSCSISFQNQYQTVKRSKAGIFLKGDGTKSDLTMNINVPTDKYDALMAEVATTSCNRLKDKFKSAGVEVIEWNDFKNKYPDAVAFEKDNMSLDKKEIKEGSVTYAGKGYGRLTAMFWQRAASSISRDAEVSLYFPNFGVGFGYFDGQATAATIKETHGWAEVQFTPQVQIYSGSGFAYQAKWDTSAMSLKKSLVNDERFVEKLDIQHDNRAERTAQGEAIRGVAMAATGAQSWQTQVSTKGAVNYNVILDEGKFKDIILNELASAEDLIIESFKNEF